jgi:hypothetical protein
MKLFRILGLLGAVVLGTTITVAAPANDSLHVNVPFSFVLAGQLFPAGVYSIQESNAGVLMVQGEGKAALALTIPANTMKAGAIPAIHFAPANGREYLVSVDDNNINHAVSSRSLETRTLTLAH